MCRNPGEELEREALHTIRVILTWRHDYRFAQLQQQFRNLNLHRAHFGARATQAGCERQPGILIDSVKLWRNDGADGPGINPRIIVAANLAVNGAMIQARTATNAI